MTRLDWRRDSSAVTFEYNERGHQVYRVISDRCGVGPARGPRSPRSRRRSSAIRARSSGTTSMRARRSSGCRSGTAGTISTSTTAPPATVKAQITKGALGGPQRRPGRRQSAADLLHRQRHVPREGSLLRSLLPHQHRRHRAAGADKGGRQSLGRAVGRRHALHRHLLAGRSRAGDRAAPDLRRRAGLDAREGRHHRARESRLEGARGLRREGARRRRPTSGA